MKKTKISIKAHNNGLGHSLVIKELENLCSVEVMVVLKIILFMFIVGKTESAQHVLKSLVF